MKTDDDIYFYHSESLARYSLFWHYPHLHGVDCRIFSSENYDLIYAKWLTDHNYGLACNLR